MKKLIAVFALMLVFASALAFVSPAMAYNNRAEENGCRGVACCKNSMYHRQDQSRGPTSCQCMANPNPGLDHRNAHAIP